MPTKREIDAVMGLYGIENGAMKRPKQAKNEAESTQSNAKTMDYPEVGDTDEQPG